MKRNLAEFEIYQYTIESFDDLISFDEYEAIRDCNYAFLDDKLEYYSTAKDVLNYIYFNDFEIKGNELWSIIIRKHPNILSDRDFIISLTVLFWNNKEKFKDILHYMTINDVKNIFLNKEMVVLLKYDIPYIEEYYSNLIMVSDGEIRKLIYEFVKKHWCGKYRWFIKEHFDDSVLEMM